MRRTFWKTLPSGLIETVPVGHKWRIINLCPVVYGVLGSDGDASEVSIFEPAATTVIATSWTRATGHTYIDKPLTPFYLHGGCKISAQDRTWTMIYEDYNDD